MAIVLKPPYRPSPGPSLPNPQQGLAPQLAAPGSRGQDARFDISGLPQVRPGVYRDAAGYEYDANGLALGNRPLFNSGLPAADANYEDWWRANPGGPGGGGGAGGSSIFGNPYYQQVLAAVNAAAAADAAGRRTGIQQALIGFGEAPTSFSDRYGDIDALTRELAAKNTSSGISTKARLIQALTDENRNTLRGLAARGQRRSGTRGYKLRRNQLKHDQGYSDALSNLLGYTGSLYSQFAQNEYQRALQMASAAQYASQFAPAPAPSYSAPRYDPGFAISNYIDRAASFPSSTRGYSNPFRAPSAGGPSGGGTRGSLFAI